MADEESVPQGEAPDHTPPYMIFLLVLFFFLTGLLGFLICHVLKKKGYRCRTGELEEEESEGKLTREDTEDCVPDDQAEDQDTVEQIVKCIIENEANAEALKEMLVNQEPVERTDPRFPRQDSAGSLPPHHHTVHSGSDRTACHHCKQSQAKRARGRARAPRGKTRPRETTVFSVGRFRVTHVGKKSGNQEKTGQSEQAECDTLQKDDKVGQSETELHERCSLREMFKDTPTDDTNGAVQRGTEPMGAEDSLETGGGNDGESHVEGLKNGTVQTESTDKGTSQTDSTHNGTAQTKDTNNGTVQKDHPNKGTAQTKDTDNGTAQTEHVGGDGAARRKSPHHGTVVIGGPAGREFRYSRVQTEDEEMAQTEDSKDDMVQMEDIKDCKVSQEEGGEEPQRGQCVETNNRKRGSAHTPHKW
ncbi:uncharacterized protein LOC117413300 [Acipenser ruthenus]|uniref:uncharacterized protein LOC117413300 n=1 Tax=Acipenser ruthenus TaxID=7906 RepID=UPI00145AE851|nr:uncharacterized protein LOC117413300 [Acipenser ruthenus]